ncbi:ABC transporter permease [Schlesneria paludicola]|uniref:ABC transporter permease n=1 Tax=Schlesneria paludicola TaxID=360056 RepID=UPI00029A6496|nr:ABC transporter permease [Schlesneria paludicola]
MWLRMACLIIKELLAVWRDPKSRFLLVAPPIIELMIFANAATQEVKNVRVGVFNQDSGIYARDLIARFEGSPNFREVVHLRSQSEIAPAIDSRTVLLVIQIGQDFSRNVAARQPTSVQLLLDGRRSNASQIMESYAEQIVGQYNAELASTNSAPPPASSVVARIWFNPNMDAYWSTVPSLVVILTALGGLMVTALSVARERELGTFEQLLVSPLSPYEIVVGKAVPAFIIGMAEGTFMVLAAVFLFHVPLSGHLYLLYAGISAFLLAIIGVGLFVSSLAKTQQQAILGAFATMVPMTLLSGFASPLQNMPEWLQYVTLMNPYRYFVVIVKGVFLKSMPPFVVVQNLGPLLLIAAITLGASSWLFRHRVE